MAAKKAFDNHIKLEHWLVLLAFSMPPPGGAGVGWGGGWGYMTCLAPCLS